MRTRRAAIGASLTAFALLAAGCGDSDPSGDSGGSITITHALGETTLEEPATNVVALEWTYVEELIALGVTPVAIADIEGYNTWVTAGERPADGIEDVGSRQEPSLERIRVLEPKPDLIVTDEDRLSVNREELEDIAPVVAFNPYEGNQLETMRTIFTELAEAVGKTDEAQAVLDEFDQRVEDVRGRLDQAGLLDTPFVLAQGFTSQNAPTMRLFTDQALTVQILAAAGLKNVWTGEPDSYGMTTVGVEALTEVPDEAHFLYVAADDDNIYTDALADNPAWTSLSFVEQSRVHPLDPGTWVFGGPIAGMQILDEAAKALGV